MFINNSMKKVSLSSQQLASMLKETNLIADELHSSAALMQKQSSQFKVS